MVAAIRDPGDMTALILRRFDLQRGRHARAVGTHLYIDNGIGSLSSLEIIDADGVKQIVKLRDPLMLPPPRT